MTHGHELVAAVQRRIDSFTEPYQRAYPAAVKCLLTDREQLTSYLRFPAEHHKRIRHSNFIERTFGETRRRVKVIRQLPGETSCLNLLCAVLDRPHASRGMTMTPAATRVLADLRHQLLDPPTPIRPKTDTDAIAIQELSAPSPDITNQEPSPGHLHRTWTHHAPTDRPPAPVTTTASPGAAWPPTPASAL